MSDILDFVPQSTAITVGGKVYNILPFTLNEMARLQKWIDASSPNPFTFLVEKLGTMSAETRRSVLQEMKTYKSPKLGTEEAGEILQSFDGTKEIFRIAVQRADPSVTDEFVDLLVGSLPIDQFSDLMGRVGSVVFGVSDDPKV